LDAADAWYGKHRGYSSYGDVNAGYWNPAGLIKPEDKQVNLMHSYFANIAQYDHLAYASP
jgi:hypothetical protein